MKDGAAARAAGACTAASGTHASGEGMRVEHSGQRGSGLAHTPAKHAAHKVAWPHAVSASARGATMQMTQSRASAPGALVTSCVASAAAAAGCASSRSGSGCGESGTRQRHGHRQGSAPRRPGAHRFARCHRQRITQVAQVPHRPWAEAAARPTPAQPEARTQERRSLWLGAPRAAATHLNARMRVDGLQVALVAALKSVQRAVELAPRLRLVGVDVAVLCAHLRNDALQHSLFLL
jgi:hypothetical protein